MFSPTDQQGLERRTPCSDPTAFQASAHSPSRHAKQDIFQRKRDSTLNDVAITISYVEIYNEQIRDLLIQKENTGVYLDLREDPIKGVSLSGATEIKVDCVEEVMSLLFQGNKRRITEATNANQTSSRSHAVFQISLTISPKTKDVNIEQICGKLSLIDLAGSERGTVTENRGMRLREGAKINQSLLALANCINALGDKTKKGSFVPYRDSKLTRMLKDSLGGNCKTVMVVTTSPSSSQFEETINTLKYAKRAKNIKTKPVENKKLVEFHIAEYKSIINELRTEIEVLRQKMKPQTSAEEFDTCDHCSGNRMADQDEAKRIQDELFENFQERIQIKRGLCELEAQNQLNEMEIRQDQELLMRYTLTKSGKLITKENYESIEEFMNLPPNLKRQLSDIKTLKASLNMNGAKKELMKKELQLKSEQAKKIMASIPQRIKHQEKRDFLELVVKNYIVQLENDELEYNLKLQEKLNIILVDEIKRLRNICEQSGVVLSETAEGDEVQELDDLNVQNDTENKNQSALSPEKKFKKKLFSNQSLYEKTKNLEKIDAEDKVVSEKKPVGSTTELTLPPIKEYGSPKTKAKLRAQSRKSKERRREFAKVEQEIKNVVDIVSSLQTITPEVINEKKVKMEALKRNLKGGKSLKPHSRQQLSKETKHKLII